MHTKYKVLWRELDGVTGQMVCTDYHEEVIAIVRLCKIARVTYEVFQFINGTYIQQAY